VNKRTWWMPWR